MPVRRLNRPIVVVLTGVENSGKTTLGTTLSQRMKWPLILESARTDAAVLNGTTTLHDLQRLQDAFIQEVKSHRERNDSPVLLCDTGGLVLDMWAREVFGQSLNRTEEAMGLMDVHLMCRTLPDWAPDPLRTLPDLTARRTLEARYVDQLESQGQPWVEVPVLPLPDRTEFARAAIANVLT